MEHLHQHARRHRHHSRREGQYVEARTTPSRTTVMERSRVQLVPRASCTSDDAPGCTKPTSTPTMAIVVAVVVPIVIAAVVLLFLHRRNIKKLREEDNKDKYASLDFGVDGGSGSRKKGEKGAEMTMTETEKTLRHGKMQSLDMDVGSPYILPAGLNASRESFHSMSRSMHDPNDPYRPVTFIKADNASARGSSRAGKYPGDNGSMYTTSSGATDRDRMNNSLLQNAQRMSQSYPPRGESISPQDRNIPEIRFPEPVASSPLNPNATLPPPPAPPVARNKSTSPEPQNEYLAFQPAVAPAPLAVQPAVEESKPAPPLPRIQSQQAVVSSANTTSFMSDSSYGEGFQVTPPSPSPQHERIMSETGPIAPEPLRPQNAPQQPIGLGVEDFGNQNRLSMSLRPLPPDDPNDNPEQRANRIRSFYKEYFDDSKPEPAGGHSYNYYEEDYGSEYLDGTVFDPHSGAFVISQPQAPYAEPVTRRAMTPPPRAPPRFRSGSNPRGPHMSGSSMASSRQYIPPRGMSSMSGRVPQPRQPLPPPMPLASLPTPAKLKEDSMVFNPIDFAPPVSFRERQNGMRPDSPLGSPRPFSPAVRPHTPLASSFDDLAVMPSPHALRKSGTFTALDFAPPPRFRDPGSNASDAGSIRSNRSGMSAAGRMAVRNGAYRVSKIPKEVVGTKIDIASALRPQLSMVSPA